MTFAQKSAALLETLTGVPALDARGADLPAAFGRGACRVGALQQRLRESVRRATHAHVWTDALLRDLAESEACHVICDVSTRHEADRVRAAGGAVLCIEAPTVPTTEARAYAHFYRILYETDDAALRAQLDETVRALLAHGAAHAHWAAYDAQQ